MILYDLDTHDHVYPYMYINPHPVGCNFIDSRWIEFLCHWLLS